MVRQQLERHYECASSAFRPRLQIVLPEPELLGLPLPVLRQPALLLLGPELSVQLLRWLRVQLRLRLR